MLTAIAARENIRIPATDRALLALSAMCTIALLATALFFGRLGLDLTDEGYYLNWISNPFIYTWSATQFGFIYHPFYVLFDGNIAALRTFNVSLTFLLSFLLASQVLEHCADFSIPRAVRTIIAGGAACSSLVLFNLWLVTPNYNSLNFQAITLTLIGVLLASSPNTRPRWAWGHVLIGVGVTLTFMAKPTSALLLAVMVMLYLGLSRRLTLNGVLYIGGAGLLSLMLLVWLIDGSPMAFAKRLQNSMVFGQILGTRHTLGQIFRVEALSLPTRELQWMLFSSAALVATGLLTLSRRRYVRGLAAVCAAIGVAALLVAVATPLEALKNFKNTRTLLMASILLSGLTLGLCWALRHRRLGVDANQLGLTLLFLSAPYIYVIGTNSNYWKSASSASFFLVLAVIPLTRSIHRNPENRACLLALIIGAQLLSGVILHTAVEYPYRQSAPLRQLSTQTPIAHGSVLPLANDYATYLTEAKTQASAAGLRPGDNAIDLSGMSPTLLYAMGAQSIGQPWAIGGYPGSAALAQEALKLVSCEQIASAWLLTEPGGPRSIPDQVLHSFGTDLQRDYRPMASWTPPHGAGGSRDRARQILYKPTHPAHIREACLSLRQGKQA